MFTFKEWAHFICSPNIRDTSSAVFFLSYEIKIAGRNTNKNYAKKNCIKRKTSQNRMGKCITNMQWKMEDIIAMWKAKKCRKKCKRNPKTRNLVCERWSHLYLCWAGRRCLIFFVKCLVSFWVCCFFLSVNSSSPFFIYVPPSCTECTSIFDMIFFVLNSRFCHCKIPVVNWWCCSISHVFR